jgi:hypothetical protein
MTKTIISDSEYNEIMMDCLFTQFSRANLSDVFDAKVLSRGNPREMCDLFEKCVKKDNMCEFIKYYRGLRKASADKASADKAETKDTKENTKVKKAVAKEANTKVKKVDEWDDDDSIIEEEDEDSSSDYVPEEEEEEEDDFSSEEEEEEEEEEYVDINATDTKGYTPLMRAVCEQNVSEVKKLLNVPGIKVNTFQKFTGGYFDKKHGDGTVYTALGLNEYYMRDWNVKGRHIAIAIRDALLNHPRINKKLLHTHYSLLK